MLWSPLDSAMLMHRLVLILMVLALGATAWALLPAECAAAAQSASMPCCDPEVAADEVSGCDRSGMSGVCCTQPQSGAASLASGAGDDGVSRQACTLATPFESDTAAPARALARATVERGDVHAPEPPLSRSSVLRI